MHVFRTPLARQLALAAAGGAFLAFATAAHADFTNGTFSSGDFTGWTPDSYLNPGITTLPPITFDDLGLTQPGTGPLSAVLSPGTAASTNNLLSWTGSAARVHTDTSAGTGRRASSIEQAITVASGDVDADGKVHVYFSAAPVLEDPGHPDDEQPYFFIELTNETTGQSLWRTFNFAGEAGVSWQNGSGQNKFTDWQAFDIALDPGQLAVGHSLKFKAVAAGCEQTGHTGAVYLQDIRTQKAVERASLWITAQGPGQACHQAGGVTNVTYTFTYENNGNALMTGVTADLVMPQVNDSPPVDAEFVSISNPSGGGTCAGPASPGDPATCNLGNLAPGSSGTFTMTVQIPAAATGNTLVNGNFSISGQTEDDVELTQLGNIVRTDLDCPAVVTPVPTLGEWALLLMAGLMAALGVVTMRRRIG